MPPARIRYPVVADYTEIYRAGHAQIYPQSAMRKSQIFTIEPAKRKIFEKCEAKAQKSKFLAQKEKFTANIKAQTPFFSLQTEKMLC